MALWKFAKSLRSFCLEPRVLPMNNFAHALTHQLKRQLMRDNKNFMTSVMPISFTKGNSKTDSKALHTSTRRYIGTRCNSHLANVSNICRQFSLFPCANTEHVNANRLLLLSKVRICSETSFYSETRMFSSSQSGAGKSSEKKDTEKTNTAQTKSPPSNNPNGKGGTPTANKAPSKKAMLKQAVKDYGSTVIVFHIAMSLCSLGIFYVLVSSGLDVVELMKKVGVGESILSSRITQGASTFVIAYAVHKVFAPVRITITLTATPLIVRKLRAVGILKKPIQK